MSIKLSITPIGGVGQIGSNMTLVSSEETTVLIDAGILFPYEDFFDINYLIPNLSFIETAPNALIITHGHEDHIGAIVHVLTQFPEMEIYAAPFAKALIEFKLKDAQLNRHINTYRESDQIAINDLLIDPIHVNHSIPETFGLHFSHRSYPWSVFFVSDFKVDPKSPYELPFNFSKLHKLSHSKTHRILLCDSTNILSRNLKTPSEGDLINDLDSILSLDGRIFASFFASNIHRLQTFINLAYQHKKKCVLYGGSLLKYSQIALQQGLLKDPHNVLTEAKSVKASDENLLVLCSGCQADFRGSFRRVIFGEDTIFKPTKDDRFIFSSKPIPGNEKKIGLLYNKLAQLGAHIITADDYHIHASGHPGKEDIKQLIDLYSPQTLIPIHGESLFIRKYEEHIAKNHPKIKSRILFNFDTYIEDTDEIIQREALEPIIIHGRYLTLEKNHLSERRKLACNGILFISFSMKKRSEISITPNGLPDLVLTQIDSFKEVLVERLLASKLSGDALAEESRIFARQYFAHHLGYKPMTFVHFMP